jgi:large subunit ribosomal protein L9
MAIEVLLRRSIEGVGNVGEVVRVRDGYARNYLLPYSLAALVTPEAMRNVEKDKAAEAVRDAEAAQERAALAEKLANVEVRIESRAGEDGHLYGSVGPRQIVDALKQKGFRFEERQIRFETVRQLGEYEVPIHLTREHDVKVRLLVVLDAEDAKAHAESAAQRAAEDAMAARIAAERGEPPPGSAPPPALAAAAATEEKAGAGEKKGTEKKGKRARGEAAVAGAEPAKAAAPEEKAAKPEKGEKKAKGGKGEKSEEPAAKGEKKKGKK